MSTLFPRLQNYLSRTGTRVNGKWASVETPATFIGSIQPASGKDVALLPEGRRDKGSVKIYSNEPLKVSLEGSNTSGDIVLWQERRWEIITAIPNQNSLIPHYKYLAVEAGAAV